MRKHYLPILMLAFVWLACLPVAALDFDSHSTTRLIAYNRAGKHAHSGSPANSAGYKDVDQMQETGDAPTLYFGGGGSSFSFKSMIMAGLIGGVVSLLIAVVSSLCRQRPDNRAYLPAVLVAVFATSHNGDQMYDSLFGGSKKPSSESAASNDKSGFEKIKSTSFEFSGVLPEPFYLNRKLEQKMWLTTLQHNDGGNAYLIAYSRLPSLEDCWAMVHPLNPTVPAGMVLTFDPDKALEGMAQKSVEAMHGTIRDKKPISVAGVDGRDLSGDLASGNAAFRQRVFISGSNVYTIAVVGTKDFVNGVDSNRFFQSFIIADRPPMAGGSAVAHHGHRPAPAIARSAVVPRSAVAPVHHGTGRARGAAQSGSGSWTDTVLQGGLGQ